MTPPVLETLRRQLRDKFPQAHAMAVAEPEPEAVAGWFEMEAFPAGAVSEVVAGRGAGLGMWLSGLLGEPAELCPHPEVALIDGADGFDPNSFSPASCSRLLWVRCQTAKELMQAADWLARDGNLPLLLADMTGLPREELRGLPASGWWRLKQIVEGTGGRLVVLSTFPLVPCARQRWHLAADWSLADFELTREELRQRLRVTREQRSRAN